jgi:hypothetical protein
VLASDCRLATNGGRVRERAIVDEHLARAFAGDSLENWI